MSEKKPYRKSIAVADHLGVALRAVHHSVGLLSCHSIEKMKLEYTEDQRVRMHEASRLAHQAEEIVKEVYANILGKIMVEEVRKY